MNDETFKIKNIEFHIKETSQNYDKCLSKAVKQFLDSDVEFQRVVKPCESLKANLDDLMKKYDDSFFFSSRRRHTRWNCDWSSDVCSSDLSCPGPWRARHSGSRQRGSPIVALRLSPSS